MDSWINGYPKDFDLSKYRAKHDASSIARQRCLKDGARSVTRSSCLQLECKRAGDREAQRVISQRIRDHIQRLERRLADLTFSDHYDYQLICSD